MANLVVCNRLSTADPATWLPVYAAKGDAQPAAYLRENDLYVVMDGDGEWVRITYAPAVSAPDGANARACAEGYLYADGAPVLTLLAEAVVLTDTHRSGNTHPDWLRIRYYMNEHGRWRGEAGALFLVPLRLDFPADAPPRRRDRGCCRQPYKRRQKPKAF
jgi:hypothetical protein